MESPAVVVLTYDRVPYLERTLASLVATPGAERYSVYVSQDGSGGAAFRDAARRHGASLMTRDRKPRLGPSQVRGPPSGASLDRSPSSVPRHRQPARQH